MDYRMPTEQDKDALLDYLGEHFENGEHNVLLEQDALLQDYSEWVRLIRSNAASGKPDWGRSLLLLCWESGRLIGTLCVRYELSEGLAGIYGHIGYGVRPSERNRGHATQMLRHALDVCWEHGLESVILGCYKANAASAAVIRKCGGVLVVENDNYTAGVTSQYYAIRR